MDILQHSNKRGLVFWYTGPMFSGKSSQLLSDYWRARHGNKRSFIFNHVSDIRYGNGIIGTHDQMKETCITIANSDELLEHYERLGHEGKIVNIFVDESEFLDSGIVSVSKKIALKGTNVYLASLNQTSAGKAFPFSDSKGSVADFVEIVDVIQTFTAVCYECGRPATKTQKLRETGSTVDVGGVNLYRPACVDHWVPRE